MPPFPFWLKIGVPVVGVVASVLLGCFAREIFVDNESAKPSAHRKKLVLWKRRPRAFRIYQFWLNAVGSAFGWVALWLLLLKAWAAIVAGRTGQITLANGALGVAAFVGVTGMLPMATVAVVTALTDLAKKVIDAAIGMIFSLGKGG